jgi:hypothetical protein
MDRAKRLARLAVLISGIGLATAVSIGAQPSAAQPHSGSSLAPPVVIRGSDPVAAQSSSTNDTVPTVLRGWPPSPPQPSAAGDVCASGNAYDPNYGCDTTGYANNPYDNAYSPYYGYWPYYGFDGFFSGDRRHGFAHGFGRGFARFSGITSPARSVRFASGFAHSGGFGHR